ncbi:MAG: putative transposase [Candidatus Azotimanducaceae bacterium]|jgi:putative transposase
MWIAWKNQLEAHPELREFGRWPYIDHRSLPKPARSRFLRNKKAVAMVVSGQSIFAAATAVGVTRGHVYSLLDRSLQCEHSDEPALTSGLIPHRQIRQATRKAPLSTLESPAGGRCSLGHLLNSYPAITAELDAHIRRFIKRAADGQNLTPKSFHAMFISLLRENNHPENCYPYTEVSYGYESVRQYLHRRVADLKENPVPKPSSWGHNCKQTRVLDQVEIDEQLTDISASVVIEAGGFSQSIRLARMSLIMMTDVASGCRMSYHLALTRTPNQDDVLMVFKNLREEWKPGTLTTPGLEYVPGAMLPSGLGGLFTQISPCMVKLDNALTHHAGSVHEHVCIHLGASINYGLPAQPKTRNVIEYAFRLVSAELNRFPSTTGKSTSDPIRESRKNQKNPPAITLTALQEAISVVIASYNAQPQAALGNRSPIEAFKDAVLAGEVTMLSPDILPSCDPFRRRHSVTVRRPALEQRSPFINFLYVRYTGAGIANECLVNEKVFLEYDALDLRTVDAYSIDGKLLGTLFASGGWGRYKHSRGLRLMIYRENRKARRRSLDPIGDYFRQVSSQTDSPTKMLEALKVAYEITQNELPAPSSLPKTDLDPVVAACSSGSSPKAQIEKWSTKLVRENREK